MQPLQTLPEPDPAAMDHSRAVKEMIRAEIMAGGGWISFAHYMRLVLYTPGMGYYSGGAEKIGPEGDFVTAPEISAFFGGAIARQVAQVLEFMQNSGAGADILEFGAGTGKLALDLLLELEKLDCLPRRYFILEVSADLRQRQRKLLDSGAPRLASRVAWLENLPDRFCGVMLANEVLDAMPVHLVVWRGDDLLERGVTCRHSHTDEFEWEDRPLIQGELLQAALALGMVAGRDEDGTRAGDHYVSEIGLIARHFLPSVAQILQKGAILLIDYGFGRDEYYHPQREQGTLMCHYRHHAHDDPFFLPGLQDITSHVDFTAIADSAANAGLELLGYTSQAHFLINCGIAEILAQSSAGNAKDYLPLSSQVQKLVSPAEMGELFKVIAFGKDVHPPLKGFISGDRSRML